MVTEISMTELMTYPSPKDQLVVVMFFGSTCGPCKATMPFYEEATEYFVNLNHKIKSVKINAWEPAEQATYCKETWNVQGVPHFKAFCGGKEVSHKIGGGNLDSMKEFIEFSMNEAFKQLNVRL